MQVLVTERWNPLGTADDKPAVFLTGRVYDNPDAVKRADMITDRLRLANPAQVLTKFVHDTKDTAAGPRVEGRKITAVAGQPAVTCWDGLGRYRTQPPGRGLVPVIREDWP